MQDKSGRIIKTFVSIRCIVAKKSQLFLFLVLSTLFGCKFLEPAFNRKISGHFRVKEKSNKI
jgi:hypothetical protein